MIYEVRTYTLRTGAVAEFEDRFAIWVYKDSTERTRVRDESRKGGQWPPQSGVRPIRQENKLLVPAAFSPLQ
jgi:hypothetical protein